MNKKSVKLWYDNLLVDSVNNETRIREVFILGRKSKYFKELKIEIYKWYLKAKGSADAYTNEMDKHKGVGYRGLIRLCFWRLEI